MSITIRDFNLDDEQTILELFALAFARPLSPDVWEWRYVKGLEQPIVKLMFDDDKLIGHYAVTPMPFLHRGQAGLTALSMTTMTHPDYQGKGIFTQLANITYDAARERGVWFVHGFPNKNSEKGFFNKLDWHRANKLKEYVLSDPPRTTLPNSVEVIDPRFGALHDDFWEKIKDRFTAVAPRTGKFLDWRITQQPSGYINGHYKLFQVRGRDGIKGFLIMKIYTHDVKPKAHIMELLTEDDGDTARELLAAAISYSVDNNASLLSAWSREGHHLEPLLFEKGFKRNDTPVVFGGRFIASSASENPGDFFDSWHISMIDSDIF